MSRLAQLNKVMTPGGAYVDMHVLWLQDRPGGALHIGQEVHDVLVCEGAFGCNAPCMQGRKGVREVDMSYTT